jgi:GGDEF domain-containing protein
MDNRTLLVSLDIVLMYGEVSAIAHIDMLTGLYTRRKFY